MSGHNRHRLREDKALRDAALALVKADISHLQADLTGKSIKARFSRRVSAGANGIFEEAAVLADDNRGVVATLIAAFVLWFARNPILALFVSDDDHKDDDASRHDFDADEYDENYD